MTGDRLEAPPRPAPLRAEPALAPFYDAARALLRGDGGGRSMLAGHIAPRPADLIVDFACGAGDLALQLTRLEPGARVMGFDPDPLLVARAQSRLARSNSAVSFSCAAPVEAVGLLASTYATKAIVTLKDIHRNDEKRALLSLARVVLDPRGALFVIDHGAQRTSLMRSLRNADRARRGAPAADGRDTLTPMIRDAGFVAVDETLSWPSPTGSMSLFRARVS